MQRIPVDERANWRDRAEKMGFAYHSINGGLYWDETAYYAFSLSEIEDELEAPTAALEAMCIELAGRAVADEQIMKRLAIPEPFWNFIAASWRRQDGSLYGRFDLRYDGQGPAKLLEYNADTPTSLFETAVFQWDWLDGAIAQEIVPRDADQFNSLHERLIAAWKALLSSMPVLAKSASGVSAPHAPQSGRTVHFAGMLDNPEDAGTLVYLADTASQAGAATKLVAMDTIGRTPKGGFVDPDDVAVEIGFKLYPWEWMFADEFGRSAAMATTRFLEPPWKLVLSNKGALALLWEMSPHHPNLLECYFEGERDAELLTRYARKPLFSREGADIELKGDGDVLRGPQDGYGAEGFVRQQLRPLPEFDGRYPVIGAWIVGDEPAGIGIREDATPLTTERARFVPHVIVD